MVGTNKMREESRHVVKLNGKFENLFGEIYEWAGGWRQVGEWDGAFDADVNLSIYVV